MNHQDETIRSPSGAPIRLTDERWAHIVEEHSELAGRRLDVLDTIRHPNRILAGNSGELLAIGEQDAGKVIVVVYREFLGDGFIITAFLTKRQKSLERRKQLWP